MNSLVKFAFLIDPMQILVFIETVLSHYAVLSREEKRSFQRREAKSKMSLQNLREVRMDLLGNRESLPKRFSHSVPSVFKTFT